MPVHDNRQSDTRTSSISAGHNVLLQCGAQHMRRANMLAQPVQVYQPWHVPAYGVSTTRARTKWHVLDNTLRAAVAPYGGARVVHIQRAEYDAGSTVALGCNTPRFSCVLRAHTYACTHEHPRHTNVNITMGRGVEINEHRSTRTSIGCPVAHSGAGHYAQQPLRNNPSNCSMSASSHFCFVSAAREN